MTLNKKWGDSREQMFGKISLRKKSSRDLDRSGKKGRMWICG